MAVDDAYTVALLHMDGGNNSTTFVDESGKTWTRGGDAKVVMAQSRFGNSAGAFDGTGDFIYTASNADFDFGAGAFTIDFWVRTSSAAGYDTLIARNNDVGGSAGEWVLVINSTAGGDIAFWSYDYNGFASAMLTTAAGLVNTGVWVHVALVRSGNDWTIYVNGVSKATRNSATTIAAGARDVYVMADQFFGRDIAGWMDELRISKGIARWTGAFTPSTDPYAAPLPTVAGVDDTYTKVLLHMNGADASTTFTDESGKAWTAAGGAQIDTAQFKFGEASGLFDGAGDYISTPNSADLDFGTGDWTIDCWVRRDGTKAYPQIYGAHNTVGAIGLYFGLGNSDNKVRVVWFNTEKVLTAGTIADLTWTHVAVVRYGNTVKVYINGTADANTDNCTGDSINSDGAGAVVGRLSTNVDDYYWKGWIDELRVTKGLARWTSNFIPQPMQYSAPKYVPWCNGGSAVVENDGKRIHTFTGSETLVVVNAGSVDCLLVGGGGSGCIGKTATYLGSGGAGGQVLVTLSNAVGVGDKAVVIGPGGVAKTKLQIDADGNPGTATTFNGLSAAGGGGGLYNTGAGGTAGDGIHTGGAPSGIYAGGGGGDSANGGAASANKGGDGGAGTASTLSGASVYYGGGGGGDGATQTNGAGGNGGGGQGAYDHAIGESGAANKGGGGGGGDFPNQDGGAGGSGIVIVSYVPDTSSGGFISISPYMMV